MTRCSTGRRGIGRTARAAGRRLAGLVVAVGLLSTGALPMAEAAAQTVVDGVTVRSWGYQLQNDSPAPIAASPYDLVVIDYTRDPAVGGPFTAAEVAQMKKKPDGGRRLVLAYVSIGEAENYRYYWADRNWGDARNRKPPVLEESAEWKGNFTVEFWEQEWQNLILTDSDSYINRIMDAGFDGILLDRVDIVDTLQGKTPAGTVASDLMAQFVRKISVVTKLRNPKFLVVALNAEGLVDDDTYRAAIDGLGKEQLLYSTGFFDPTKPFGAAKPVDPADVAWSTERLAKVKADGKLVLCVEYINQPDLVQKALGEFAKIGCVPYFGPRDLSYLAYTKPATAK